MEECIFCNIINKTAKAEVFFEDDKVIVIQDILPKAPVHLLVLTKKHIPSVNEFEEVDELLAGHMILTAQKVAKDKNVSEQGYKLIFNVGHQGGQIVKHVHLHLLGGKQFSD